jgi:predicted DNA-binding protein
MMMYMQLHMLTERVNLDGPHVMPHTYGMAVMEHRTSFALDEETLARLGRLAALWQISKAEVVRRAIEKAEKEAMADRNGRLARLKDYQSQGTMVAEAANAYLDQLAEDRNSWRGQP